MRERARPLSLFIFNPENACSRSNKQANFSLLCFDFESASLTTMDVKVPTLEVQGEVQAPTLEVQGEVQAPTSEVQGLLSKYLSKFSKLHCFESKTFETFAANVIDEIITIALLIREW